MEQQHRDSSCSTPSSVRCPVFLGYFLQPHCEYYHDDEYFFIDEDGGIHPADPPTEAKKVPVIQFVYSSKEGKDLQEGIWGGNNMDASLAFLDLNNKAQIVASSNGFLLCCTSVTENMQYAICNPVTREFKLLPEPHKVHRHVAIALIICRSGDDVDDPSRLDGMNYEVVRIGVLDPIRGMGRTLEIETFSSWTGEWRKASLTTTVPLSMHGVSTCVLQDVIFWNNPRCKLVAYDPARACVEIMDLPEEDPTNLHLSEKLGISEGKIMYSRAWKEHLEVWAMEDYNKERSNPEWILKRHVSFSRIFQENPSDDTKAFGRRVVGFHPSDSQLVLVTLNDHPYWFDLGSCKLNKLGGYKHYGLLCNNYFKYEWPCNPYRGAADH